MAKKRRGKRRNKRSSNSFVVYSHERRLDKLLLDENHKSIQAEYLSKFKKLEQDLLSRTVLVTNVKDLRKPGVKLALESFLRSRYGEIASCVLVSQRKVSFPAARVTFQRKEDAERIFGGTNLLSLQMARNQHQIEIACPAAGHKGYIRVRAETRSDEMMKDALSGDTISLSLKGVSIGHWCPYTDDVWEGIVDHAMEWQEEKSICEDCTLRFNPAKRLVELRLFRPFESVNEESGLIELNQVHVASFRFKDIRHFIDIRQESGTMTLLLSLKNAPRLEVERKKLLSDEYYSERTLRFGNVDGASFGRCFGFKLSVSEGSANLLREHHGFSQMKRFGVFRDSQAGLELTQKRIDETERKKLDIVLRDVQRVDPYLGKDRCERVLVCPRLLTYAVSGFNSRALLDSGCVSWSDLLHDSVTYDKDELNLHCLLLRASASGGSLGAASKVCVASQL